jgi:hypothetical protein
MNHNRKLSLLLAAFLLCLTLVPVAGARWGAVAMAGTGHRDTGGEGIRGVRRCDLARALQAEQVALSSRGEVIVAEASGRAVPLEQPEASKPSSGCSEGSVRREVTAPDSGGAGVRAGTIFRRWA